MAGPGEQAAGGGEPLPDEPRGVRGADGPLREGGILPEPVVRQGPRAVNRRGRGVQHLHGRRVPEQQRDPVLRHVQPCGAPGVLRRAVHPRGPVAVPPLPPVAVVRRRLLPLSEQGRRVQADGRRPLGARRVRALDPRGRLREHRLPRADRQHRAHPGGALEAVVLHLQAARHRCLHPVPQDELLHGVPRDVRAAGGALHEDRADPRDERQRDVSERPQDGLLRRAHAAGLRVCDGDDAVARRAQRRAER